MMPTYVSLHLAADRQRDLEHRAAQRRLAHSVVQTPGTPGFLRALRARIGRISPSTTTPRPLATPSVCGCPA